MKYPTLSRAFLLSRILGAFPFSLSGEKVKVSYLLLVYSLFVQLSFAPPPILNIFQASFIMSRTKTHLTTATVGFIFVFVFSTISYACYFWNRSKLDMVLKNYALADEAFTSLGHTPYTRVTVYLDTAIILVCHFLPLVRAYVTPNLSLYMMYQLMYLSHVMASMFMLVQPFICLVGNLRIRIHKLRAILRHEVRSGPSHENNRRIQAILKLHNLLCSTCDIINDIFSQNILFVVFIAFFQMTTYLYYGMRAVYTSLTVTMIQGIVVMFYLVILYMTSAYCDRMTEETREFNVLLFHLIIDDLNDEITNNSKMRLHVAMKREVVITACGLFSVDYSLVHSMISAATTYLIILIEMGD